MKKAAYILAGEPSGDKLAGCLMRSQQDKYRFYGIGGPLMHELGLQSNHDYEALQVIGLFDALKQYRSLKQLLNALVDEVCTLRPEVIFTIDAKAFSLRFARAVKARMASEGWHAPLIHMVAPTIWAYGAGRKASFEEAFDGMLCLFPMEIGVFDADKIVTKFIGHPAAYQKALPRPKQRSKPLKLLLLPGSRAREIDTLLPAFLEAVAIMREDQEVSVTIATIAAQIPQIKHIIGNDSDVLIVIGEDALKDSFASHDMMMAASGTVTLEAALAAIPGIVAYQLNPLIAFVMKRRFLHADPVLPNIILGERLYPFFFQNQARAKPLAGALQRLRHDEGADDLIAGQSARLRQSLLAEQPSFEDAITKALDEMLSP